MKNLFILNYVLAKRAVVASTRLFLREQIKDIMDTQQQVVPVS
jgi:hypothetical protein